MDYIIKHIEHNRRCKECGTIVVDWSLPEDEDTPYECSTCDCSMSEEYTVEGNDITFDEFEKIVRVYIKALNEYDRQRYEQYRKDWYKARVELKYIPGHDEEPACFNEWFGAERVLDEEEEV